MDPICTVFLLYALARAAGVTPEKVADLDRAGLDALFAAVDAFPSMARRRVFQEAYERRYRRQILDALAAHRPHHVRTEGRALAQLVFCIDEREESFRRAVEEIDQGYVTYGVAGFFGVAIDYRGLDDVRPAPYAPVVVIPAHEVHETPVYTDRGTRDQRQRRRGAWNRFQQALHYASRTPLGGAVQSVVVGAFTGLAVGSQVLAPRQTQALGRRVLERFIPRPLTRLQSLRTSPDARSDRGKYLGFTLQEKADRVAATLTNIGLTRDFAPLVIVVGHGSTSLNNPHESAHDCGACGGRRGGANARLFAEMANRPDVRAALMLREIHVPNETWFVGGLHDTSDDSITFYDLEDLPPDHIDQFDQIRAALDRSRRQNALERARRFHDAPLSLTPEAALRHVEDRAAHLAQPRPEYGHCTNAIAVVGRRSLTRGLFLDRRPFLVSYDPTIDRDYAVIERILAAVGPVGAGINLEYYFSAVDNERFGCGTKLPHNMTGLIGVMNGSSSDLRTGLPKQMVELHEPMRLLLVVEATPEALLTVAGRQAEVRQLVVNGWVQLVSLDPDTGAMAVFQDGAFVPYTPAPIALPVVRTSPQWFSRSRDHLPPARIEAPGV